MIDQKLTDYIQSKRVQGLSNDYIKQKLLAVGWPEAQVNQALFMDSDIPLPISETAPAPSQAMGNNGSNFWDVFEHVILFISLYVFTTSLGLLIHSFIDQYLPATTYNDYYSSYSYGSTWRDQLMVGYASALIVSFPVFYFLFRRITIRTLKDPSLRRGKIRKFLIYLTLVGTFVILIYKAITTVYSFLMGNITVNFLLHFVVTVGIAGAIFAYYFNEVKEDRNALNRK